MPHRGFVIYEPDLAEFWNATAAEADAIARAQVRHVGFVSHWRARELWGRTLLALAIRTCRDRDPRIRFDEFPRMMIKDRLMPWR